MRQYIDISFPLNKNMAIYPNNPTLEIERLSDIENGDSATVSRISFGSHTGTHIDAPSHNIIGGKTLDQIPLERFNGTAHVIEALGVSDITESLLVHYNIKNDDIVIFKTDNTDMWRCDCVLDDYVTLTYDAAEYLSEKKVKMVGIDYLTIERPQRKREKGKSVHRVLLEKDVLICEGLSLRGVKPGEYEQVCFPLNIELLDGCPVRCVLIQ